MIHRRVSSICALLTTALGTLTLIGWISGHEALASLRRNYIPMAPSTALGFAALGMIMVLHNANRIRRPISEILLACVVVVAGGKLWEFFSGMSLGVEELIVADPTMFGGVQKGRMSPITAMEFLLICFAILALGRHPLRDSAGRVAVVALSISFVVVLGYIHGTPLLYGGQIIPVALPTAVAFILLSVSVVLAAGPAEWPLQPMIGDSARAVLLRWFLPAAVAVALLDGFTRTRFVTHWQLNPALSSALSTLLYIIVITVVISQVSRLVGGRIDRAESERNAAKAELEALNRDLEKRIAERTQELRSKNEQMQEELTMARELQFALLPQHFPSIPRSVPECDSALQFFSFYYPAGTVSGDFFDVFPVSESAVGIFICDVMGHGVRAALVTSMMRALLEQHAGIDSDPGKLLTQMNRELFSILQHTGTTIYATAVMMIADAARQELLYANAGHPKPLHVRRGGGDTVPLTTPGKSRALGLFPDADYLTTRTQISTGDVIMLFTDGLFEVEDPEGTLYSHSDLLAAVRQHSALAAPELLKQVLADVQAFARRPDFEDDVCVIGVEVARRIDPTASVSTS
jgi:serine phosphatase RsbU (regulator of sigma subunit)